MGVLLTLALGVVPVAPHDNVSDLVQDPVCLFEVPAAFLSLFKLSCLGAKQQASRPAGQIGNQKSVLA